jgi:hypothetical protein
MGIGRVNPADARADHQNERQNGSISAQNRSKSGHLALTGLPKIVQVLTRRESDL